MPLALPDPENKYLILTVFLNQLYANHTGQPVEKIEEALERDNFMSPDNAKKFGIIDDIQTKRVVEKTEK